LGSCGGSCLLLGCHSVGGLSVDGDAIPIWKSDNVYFSMYLLLHEINLIPVEGEDEWVSM
jgi:hypothetical protein